MKTTSRVTITLASIVLFVWGCSGIQVSQDYESNIVFSDLKTYTLEPRVPDKTGDIRTNNPLMDERITNAIGHELNAKGMTQTNTGPDVLVSYQYNIRTKLSTSSGGPNFGFALGTSRRGSAFGFSTGTDISQYDEGQLAIDMKLGTSGQMIWRGTSTFKVETHVKPEKMTEKINAAVKKTLAQFPPIKK